MVYPRAVSLALSFLTLQLMTYLTMSQYGIQISQYADDIAL